MKQFGTEWSGHLRWEQLAADGDVRVARVLGDITLTEQVLCRAFYECCMLSSYDPWYKEIAEYIADAISGGFHDEKLPEDLHNHGRDLARLGKASQAIVKNLHCACLTSGVLELRQTGAIAVSNADVALLGEHATRK